MPLLGWLTGSNGVTVPVLSQTSGTASTTSAQGGGVMYVPIQDPSHTHASILAALYQQQNTASATAWYGLQNATTSTTSTGACYFIYDASQDTWFTQEEVVQQSQYVALARQRVAFTEQERAAAIAAAEAQRRQFEEENARWRREEAERQERQKAAQERQRAAYEKSRELLLQHLTPAQRKTFEENQWFVVQGGATKKTYRIRTTGYTGNIEEMRGNSVTHRLCGHLPLGYALHDHHVAQKVSLEWDEENFVRICNRHRA